MNGTIIIDGREYAKSCPHGENPKENCNRCCKYCGIPFRCCQVGEDEFEVTCDECGYDVS